MDSYGRRTNNPRTHTPLHPLLQLLAVFILAWTVYWCWEIYEILQEEGFEDDPSKNEFWA